MAEYVRYSQGKEERGKIDIPKQPEKVYFQTQNEQPGEVIELNKERKTYKNSIRLTLPTSNNT